MSDSAPPAATCPNCGAVVAPGRFCSACGRPLDLHATAAGVARDALGMRTVSLAGYGRTAWLALAEPATLSRRWIAGERAGLVSPVAMMGAVTLATALVGFVLTRLTGHRAEAVVLDLNGLLLLAPFLQNRFPQAMYAAALDRNALTDQFRGVGGWFAAFWPSLLVGPGWLALLPWRRIDRRAALIFAIVEAVFLLMLSGLHAALKLALPGVMASGFATLAFAAAVVGHGAVHVRGLTGAGWGYALTRPLLAAVWILPVAYVWVVFVLTLTLAFWT